MNEETLISAGLTEELAKKVIQLHQKAIDGNYVPKATFEAEREKVKTHTATIAERDKQITELGKFKGSAEELTTKVAELEKQNKEDKEAFDEQLRVAQEDALLRTELLGKVHDPEDVITKLDRKLISIKDGKIESGLSEQLTKLKEAKPHYFKTEEKQEGPPAGWLWGDPPAEGGDNKNDKKPTEAEQLGAFMAKVKLAGSAAVEKAAETYFR